MATLIATPGASNANSYETHAEANEYFDSRPPLNPPWVASGQEAYLIQATRVLDAYAQPFKTLTMGANGIRYYYTRRQWTGAPSTTTQRLAWPRTGMFDRNGNPIPADVIPQELKDAESELAGQLKKTDLTLNNDVLAQGVKSLSAGSVSMSFRDNFMVQVIPDAVWNLMPPSWFTDELWEPALSALFDVVS